MSIEAAWGVWIFVAVAMFIVACSLSAFAVDVAHKKVPIWPWIVFGVWVGPVALRAFFTVLAA